MSNIFQHVLAQRPKRSTFNLSHDVKLTGEFGQLIPFMCEETVPGDTWKNTSEVLVRFAPLKAPVMHKMYVTTHFFFVPWRLLWDDYEEFITGGRSGHANPTFPYVTLRDGREGSDYFDELGFYKIGSLADYLNYPTSDSSRRGGGMHLSALPLRAYQLIYDEYYRDENLEASLEISKASGEVEYNSAEWRKLFALRHRAWRKDYFTSALPWPQRGDQQTVPVHGTGSISEQGRTPVQFDNRVSPQAIAFKAGENNQRLGDLKLGNFHSDADGARNDVALYGPNAGASSVGSGISVYQDGYFVELDGKRVNIDTGHFDINELRRASRIQKWLERQSRSGSRYVEALLSHFGILSDDARFQRPEFLGGGVNPVQIGDVLQTSQTTTGEGGSPLAQPAGVGWSRGGSNSFNRTFKERGYIIGILSVCPVPSYSEGVPIGYHKNDKFQFYWPEFAQLGEQPIYNFELALRGDNIADTFGYAPRYAEYKYIPSRVHGDFKDSLAFWTLNRHYDAQPTLSHEFISIDANANDLNRIFAVESDAGERLDHLWVQIVNNTIARRPMPYLPDPSL